VEKGGDDGALSDSGCPEFKWFQVYCHLRLIIDYETEQ